MTVLLITYGVPLPCYGGSALRDYNTLVSLSRRHRVILLCHTWAPGDERRLPELLRYCDAVDSVPVRRSLPRKLTAVLRGFAAGRPLALFPYYFEEMAAKLRGVFATRAIDLVQIEQSLLAAYIDVLPSPRACQAVLSFHNVASRQYRSMVNMDPGLLRKALYILKAAAMARWETRYVSRFDRCIAVSALEKEFLESRNPNVPVSVVPNGVDTASRPRLPEPEAGNTLIFVGNMAYAPNADAVLYFCRSIFPLVKKTVADTELLVVGLGAPPKILDLARQPGVRVIGAVSDVTPYYAASKVAVVPLRAGGGTRCKILEAMAFGRPVVSTPVGCEGLEVTGGEDILIADTPRAFAERVSLLLLDPDLARRLCDNARRLVEARYDWQVVHQPLMSYNAP